MIEKIEEDKQVQQEITVLRQQELEMMHSESEKFFGLESQRRKECELHLLQLIEDKT
jgi:hypothetical protein